MARSGLRRLSVYTWCISPAWALAVALAPLGAQSALRTHDGVQTEDFHGFAVARLLDLTGDGVPDYAVSSSNSRYGSLTGRGSVTVYSGADGSIVHIIPGDRAGMRFGWSISRLGDVNGDGVPDLVVGAPYDDRGGWHAGLVAVHSGADGRAIWRQAGLSGNPNPSSGRPQEGSLLGWSVSFLDDLDGDGCVEVVAGAPTGDITNRVPAVFVYSGRTGALMSELNGDRSFGTALCTLGDLDGDGAGDLLVGAPKGLVSGMTAGYASVYSARLLTRRYALNAPFLIMAGDAPSRGLGRAVELLDDVDGDGRRDLMIAAERAYNIPGAPALHSLVEIRSGRDGRVLRRHVGAQTDDDFGAALRSVGDMNGDGKSEYAIGSPSRDGLNGFVQVFDGATGDLRFERAGGPRERLGYAIDRVGDLDGDAGSEVLVGAPLADSRAVKAGRAYVLRSAPDGSIRSFGVGCVGPAGPAALSVTGPASAGSDLRLYSGVMLRPMPGTLVFGLSATQWAGGALPLRMAAFGAPNCWLNVEPRELLPTVADQRVGTGWQWQQTVRLPSGSAAYGQRFYLQYLSIDPGAPGGYVLSNGVEVWIGG